MDTALWTHTRYYSISVKDHPQFEHYFDAFH